MQISAAQLAQIIQGEVEGDPSAMISHPAKIEEAGAGGITFLADPAYESFLYTTGATAVLVSQDFQPKQAISCTLIRVANVRMAVGQLLTAFQENEAAQIERTIAEQAVVDPNAQVGEQVAIGRFSIVEAGAHIGHGTLILDQVYIGTGARIGKNCTLYPGVRISKDCEIGDNCVLHANVVIGSDGFGFAPQADGSYTKVPQLGKVIVEDDVEIGANTVIDRATMGATLIRKGVKLDNLIQIGHNVEIGENTVIAAQAGIAGSSKIGKGCRIGGQVGIAGHLSIADGTQLQAQSGVGGHLREAGASLMGSPALNYRDFQRSYVVFKQLPQLYRELDRLKKELADLRDQES
ncbi:MAG: UDP-3-O-(3-hydroxymyristoyl)glucosamine N-acyltransferase [Bacteroidota bacterium]